MRTYEPGHCAEAFGGVIVSAHGCGLLRPSSTARLVFFCLLAACLVSLGGDHASAQSSPQVSESQVRRLTRACGRTGTPRACVEVVRGSLRGIAALVIAELRATPSAALRAVPMFVRLVARPVSFQATPRVNAGRAAAIQPPSRVVRDGTFLHPPALAFSVLKGWTLVSATGDACTTLPDALRVDRALLQRLICEAERELTDEGPDVWPDERRELDAIRGRLAACLPAASAASACKTP
jgi:hypothetical protein